MNFTMNYNAFHVKDSKNSNHSKIVESIYRVFLESTILCNIMV